jgi:hypothetical protein
MGMHRLTVLSNGRGIRQDVLVAALRQRTLLSEEMAASIAQCAVVASVVARAHFDWASDYDFPAEQVADVLIDHGFDISFDA